MDVLIDTNVLLDSIEQRSPFQNNADKILQACYTGAVNGFIAAHSITNMFFILRKAYSVGERKQFLLELCRLLTVVGIDNETITNAIRNENFPDVEDGLQSECAKEVNADFIVTRNISDFRNSSIPAILPEDFLQLVAGDSREGGLTR
jgi:predicted nucleic acid-binding protein